MKYKRFKTPNGVNVILYPLNDIHSVRVIIKTYGGNFIDGNKKFGISHLLEHIILASNQEETRKIESYGGWLNGEAEDENITFVGGCHYRYAEKYIASIINIITNCKITEQVLKKEKETIKNEIMEAKSNVESFAWHKVQRARFIGHYRKSLIDSEKAIDAISISGAKSLYSKMLNPSRMHIAVCGKINSVRVRSTLEKVLGKIPYIAVKDCELSDPIYSKELIKKYKFDIDGAKVYITLPGLTMKDSIKERLTLNLIASALNDTHNSRLFKLLRDEKLTYDVGTSTIMRSKCGLFVVDFMCLSKNITKSIKTIKDTLENIASNGLTDDEIQHHKNYLDLTVDTYFDYPENVCEWLVDDMIYEREIVLPDKIREIRRSITRNDVNKIAKKIFDLDKINIVIVGNIGVSIIS